MGEVPRDLLTLAVEGMKKTMEEVGQKETEARLLNVERAQAYALMGIAESLTEFGMP